MKEPLLDKIKEEMPEYSICSLRSLLTIILAILHKETCSLYKLRGTFGRVIGKSGSKPSSHYQRMVRFFGSYHKGSLWIDLLRLSFRLLNLKVDYLALDGTSWQYGSRKVHLLMLCAIYKGVAIPVYWHDLEKKGTSNTAERKRLFTEAVKHLSLSGKVLLADREYIGKDWFKFLTDSGIDFVIRLKRGCYREEIDQAGGLRYSALEKKLLRSRVAGKTVAKPFEISGMQMRIVMAKNLSRNDKDAIIYLLSSTDMPAKKVAGAYFMRWKIETCFKHMKSSGFDMERINLEGTKARLMVATLTVAYTLSVLEGIKEYSKASVKKYSDGTAYKPVAAFREGIDAIVATCDYFKDLAQYILKVTINAKKAYRSPKAIFV